MKISDQGFTERLPGQANRSTSVGGSGCGSSSTTSFSKQSSDNLQLSNLASRLQSAGALDPQRSARINQIAKAVGDNTFHIDTAQISSAIVSEAVQSTAR